MSFQFAMGEIFRSFLPLFSKTFPCKLYKWKKWLFMKVYFVLSYFSITDRPPACYTFPYLLSKISLIFYHENTHLSPNSFNSSVCHRQANSPHLHTHSHTSSLFVRRYLQCGFRGVAIPSHGAAPLMSHFGAPIHWPPQLSFCLPFPWASLFGWLKHRHTLQALWQNQRKEWVCSTATMATPSKDAALQVSQFSTAAIFLRGLPQD